MILNSHDTRAETALSGKIYSLLQCHFCDRAQSIFSPSFPSSSSFSFGLWRRTRQATGALTMINERTGLRQRVLCYRSWRVRELNLSHPPYALDFDETRQAASLPANTCIYFYHLCKLATSNCHCHEGSSAYRSVLLSRGNCSPPPFVA